MAERFRRLFSLVQRIVQAAEALPDSIVIKEDARKVARFAKRVEVLLSDLQPYCHNPPEPLRRVLQDIEDRLADMLATMEQISAKGPLASYITADRSLESFQSSAARLESALGNIKGRLPDETTEELASIRGLLQRTRFELAPEHAQVMTQFRAGVDGMSAAHAQLMEACQHIMVSVTGSATQLGKETFEGLMSELLAEHALVVQQGDVHRDVLYLRALLDVVRLTHRPSGTPLAFICPLTNQVMHDPVVLEASGFSFERRAIEVWHSKGKRICPRSGKPLGWRLHVQPNHNLKQAIDDWRLFGALSVAWQPLLAQLHHDHLAPQARPPLQGAASAPSATPGQAAVPLLPMPASSSTSVLSEPAEPVHGLMGDDEAEVPGSAAGTSPVLGNSHMGSSSGAAFAPAPPLPQGQELQPAEAVGRGAGGGGSVTAPQASETLGTLATTAAPSTSSGGGAGSSVGEDGLLGGTSAALQPTNSGGNLSGAQQQRRSSSGLVAHPSATTAGGVMGGSVGSDVGQRRSSSGLGAAAALAAQGPGSRSGSRQGSMLAVHATVAAAFESMLHEPPSMYGLSALRGQPSLAGVVGGGASAGPGRQVGAVADGPGGRISGTGLGCLRGNSTLLASGPLQGLTPVAVGGVSGMELDMVAGLEAHGVNTPMVAAQSSLAASAAGSVGGAVAGEQQQCPAAEASTTAWVATQAPVAVPGEEGQSAPWTGAGVMQHSPAVEDVEQPQPPVPLVPLIPALAEPVMWQDEQDAGMAVAGQADMVGAGGAHQVSATAHQDQTAAEDALEAEAPAFTAGELGGAAAGTLEPHEGQGHAESSAAAEDGAPGPDLALMVADAPAVSADDPLLAVDGDRSLLLLSLSGHRAAGERTPGAAGHIHSAALLDDML